MQQTKCVHKSEQISKTICQISDSYLVIEVVCADVLFQIYLNGHFSRIFESSFYKVILEFISSFLVNILLRKQIKVYH